MSDQPESPESLAEQFRNLGLNLLNILQTAWESPERKRLQEEILEGLNEAGSTFKREADQFRESSTGQQIRSEVERLGGQLSSRETQEKVRLEVLSALRNLNTELENVARQWSSSTTGTDGEKTSAEPPHSPDQG